MKEQDIKWQFLEEVQDYLNIIESGAIGCAAIGRISSSQLDTVLRAAHSIKGGAAMMGFETLSHLAHRLEDFFKVLKSQRNLEIDETVERLFLTSVDRLRYLTTLYRQGKTDLDLEEFSSEMAPIFAGLREKIGELSPETTISLVSEDAGEDMTVLLFQTEVEGCLQRLESILEQPQQPCLKEEMLLAAQELGGLGEMLELNRFSQLCASIERCLETATDGIAAIATQAIQAWRRSQAMVTLGRKEAIPTELSLECLAAHVPEALTLFGLEDETPIIQDFFSSPDGEPELPLEALLQEVAPTEERSLRVSYSLLTELADLFGETTIAQNGLDSQLKRLRRSLSFLSQRIRRLEGSSQALQTAYDRGNRSTTSDALAQISINSNRSRIFANLDFDRLEMDRYSDLHPVSQEVIETIFQIEEVANDLDIYLGDTEKTAIDLQRTSGVMQTLLTQARMRPLADLVAHFPRMLRDMSLKYGKSVTLKIEGGTTLMDRMILETLNDPLLHLFRNAFAHGIESPQIRQALGKPPQGTITISAYHRSHHTVIQIQDDGAGIDLDKIGLKALQLGIDENDLAKASREELLNLIFEPGFSTAEHLSDLSGRGVGMDIVRTQVQQMQGEIQVSTQAGQGTTFTITVPMTLSRVRVLLLEVEGMMLAVPCNAVETMSFPSPDRLIASGGQTFFKEEKRFIPLTRFQDWLHIPTIYRENDYEIAPHIDRPTVLVIAQGSDRVGIWVDRYWGEQEVTIRPVEGHLKLPKGFTGCTILGDGRVVPLIDPPTLLQHRRPNALLPSASLQPPVQKETLLVIDDSINVRRLIAVTLEKAGYRVEQAKDGQDALEQLQRGLMVQGIICDIEMPRLDGYGFLAHFKSDAIGKDIPVVMLTSRSGDKHRTIAMHLGASAYFSKPFQDRELLQTLQSLIQTKAGATAMPFK